MNKAQIEQARKVLSNLKDHPLCFTPEIIKNFENKLDDRKYSNFKDFSQDLTDQIDETFKNETLIHFLDSRQHALHVVQKELNKAYLYDADTWSKLIIKYNDRYKSSLLQLSDTKQKYLSMNDLHNFISATEHLKDEKSVHKMIKIIKNKEPKQNVEKSNIMIDLTKLQKPTILALIDFAKEALAKKGISYPS